MVRRHLSISSYRRAQARMRRRPLAARRADRRRNAKRTTSLKKWLRAPARYDIRGIDTKRRRRHRRR